MNFIIILEETYIRLVKLDMLSINLLRLHSMIRCCGQRHFHCRPSLLASARTHMMRTNSSSYLKARGSITVSPSCLCLRSRLRLNSSITAFRPPVHRVIVQSTREFHSSGRLRAVPAPLMWLVLKPLQKLIAIILGRWVTLKSSPPVL